MCEIGSAKLYKTGEVEIEVGRGKKGISTKTVRFTYRVSHDSALPSMHCSRSNWVNRCCCVSVHRSVSLRASCFVCGHWSHVPAGLIIIPADGFSWVYCISFQGDRLSQSLPRGDTERVCVCSADWRLSDSTQMYFLGLCNHYNKRVMHGAALSLLGIGSFCAHYYFNITVYIIYINK